LTSCVLSQSAPDCAAKSSAARVADERLCAKGCDLSASHDEILAKKDLRDNAIMTGSENSDFMRLMLRMT
jgi:hypothetical protein